MKAWDYLVEHDFLLAYVLAIITVSASPGTGETVLLIDHLPYRWTIIVGERLNIDIKVKVLPLVVFLILHMPNPTHLLTTLLTCPFFLQLIIETDINLMLHLVGRDPVSGNVLLVTSAYCTAFGLADLGSGIQLAFTVQVGPECPEILCFYEGV